MLVARGYKAIGGASLRWALVFARGLWFKIVETRGLALDTRFVPAAPEPARPNVCLYLLVSGTLQTFGARRAAGTVGILHPFEIAGGEALPPRTALAMRFDHLEGADGTRCFAFRANGDPCVAIEAHFAAEDARSVPQMPERVSVDAEAWGIAARAGELSANDDTLMIDSLRHLLPRLVDGGFLTPGAASRALVPPPKALLRLWRAVRPMVEHFAVAATMSDLQNASGLSASQAERELRRWIRSFWLVGPGLRGLTRHVRLKAAILFLSANGASVTDVAEATGYGSLDAMGRAFRDAGLAPPSVVQREVSRL
jgi:AraC-like DNA-binding protein